MRSIIASLLLALATPAIAAGIAPFQRGTFAQIRATHAGRPTVVHFWSVTCLPCLVEMPRLAAFSREHPGVDLVFVSTDPIDKADRIESRLQKFALTDAQNFAYADTFEERLRFEVDRTWHGELPFTVLVATTGQQKTVTCEMTPEQLQEWLTEVPPR